jgi:hypothetical protein
MQKIKSFSNILSNLSSSIYIYKYSIEEERKEKEELGAIRTGSKRIIKVYSNIHKAADWKLEYTFRTKQSITDINLFVFIQEILINLKKYHQYVQDNDLTQYNMCIYKGIILRILSINFKRKKMKVQLIQDSIKNHIDIEDHIDIDFLKNFDKITFIKPDKSIVRGKTLYHNGNATVYRSIKALKQDLNLLE